MLLKKQIRLRANYLIFEKYLLNLFKLKKLNKLFAVKIMCIDEYSKNTDKALF